MHRYSIKEISLNEKFKGVDSWETLQPTQNPIYVTKLGAQVEYSW